MTRKRILAFAIIGGIVAFLGFLGLAVRWFLEHQGLIQGTEVRAPTPAQVNGAFLRMQIYAALAFVSAGSVVMLTVVRIAASRKTSPDPGPWA